ncbi:MAG: hypothetical protein AAF939_19730 [Planctomycetota bacterium]
MGWLKYVFGLLVIVLLCVPCQYCLGELHSDSPGLGENSTTLSTIAVSKPEKKKRIIAQSLSDRLPRRSQMDRGMGQFLNELSRLDKGARLAGKIEPWVYTRGSEIMVADYEHALNLLDLANAELYSALISLVEPIEISGSALGTIKSARLKIDEATLTIEILAEIARFQLTS